MANASPQHVDGYDFLNSLRLPADMNGPNWSSALQ